MQLVGVGMIVVAELFEGGQLVSEEYCLRKIPMHPLQIQGYEGLIAGFGILPLLVIFQVLKGTDAGSQESTIDSLLMICHSEQLSVVLTGYLVCYISYFIFGIIVTAKVGAGTFQLSRLVFSRHHEF